MSCRGRGEIDRQMDREREMVWDNLLRLVSRKTFLSSLSK